MKRNHFIFFAAFLMFASFAGAPAAAQSNGVDATPPTAARLSVAPGDYNIIRVEVRNTQRSAVRAYIDLRIINPDGQEVWSSRRDDERNSRIQVRKSWFKQFRITADPKISPLWITGDYSATLSLLDPKTGAALWTLAGGAPSLFKFVGSTATERIDTSSNTISSIAPDSIGRIVTVSSGSTNYRVTTGTVGTATGFVTFDDAEAVGRALSDAWREKRLDGVMSLLSPNLSGGVSYAQAQEAVRQFFNNVNQINLAWYTDGVTLNPSGPDEVKAHADLQYFDPGTNKLEIRKYTLSLQMQRESDGKIRIVSGNFDQITLGLPSVSVAGVTTSGPPIINDATAPRGKTYTIRVGTTVNFADRYTVKVANVKPGARIVLVDRTIGGTTTEIVDGQIFSATTPDTTIATGGNGGSYVWFEGTGTSLSIQVAPAGGTATLNVTSDVLRNINFVGSNVDERGVYFIVNPDGQKSNEIPYELIVVGTP